MPSRRFSDDADGSLRSFERAGVEETAEGTPSAAPEGAGAAFGSEEALHKRERLLDWLPAF
jgi:hypothetical protein